MTSQLDGKRLVVMGASSGIGRAIGLAAAARGAAVCFAARRPDALQEAAAEAGRACAVVVDVRDETSVVEGLAEARARLGGVDGFVYSTGMSPLGPVADLGAADWQAVFETNVVGAALVARELVGHMGESGIGAFVSSISVGRPRRGLVSYSASKAALDELVRGLRTEYRDRRFLRIVVGDTLGTDFGTGFDPDTMTALLPHWIVEAHLYTRQMDPRDVAETVVAALATAYEHPGVELSDLRLEPPGGLLTLPPTPDALSAFTPPE
jgi:NAD(P)-dependent dehydrogenase (short-subunit alcohol dehydrogenase family)